MAFNNRRNYQAKVRPKTEPTCVVITGLPGSGKGSISKFLCEHYEDVCHLSTGEIFREIKADPDHPLSKHINHLLEANQLIDDETTYKVLMEALKKVPKNTILLLDGFPRTFKQALWFCKDPVIQSKFRCFYGFRMDVSLEDCKYLMLHVRRRESDTEDGVTQRLLTESVNLNIGVYKVLDDYFRLVKIQGYPRPLDEIAIEIANNLRLTPKETTIGL